MAETKTLAEIAFDAFYDSIGINTEKFISDKYVGASEHWQAAAQAVRLKTIEECEHAVFNKYDDRMTSSEVCDIIRALKDKSNDQG